MNRPVRLRVKRTSPLAAELQSHNSSIPRSTGSNTQIQKFSWLTKAQERFRAFSSAPHALDRSLFDIGALAF